MTIRHFNQLPKAYLAYPKIIKGAVLKKTKAAISLPDLEYVVDGLHIDIAHVQTYKWVCGYANDVYVPAIYFAVLSQSLQMHMMIEDDFPFVVLGIVHTQNRVMQSRKLRMNETYTLSCKYGELKPHHKGQQFEFITTVSVGDEVVAQATSTYLSRQKTVAVQPAKPAAEQPEPAYQLQEVWDVAENTGREYAKASSDYNLIHLHAMTAKLFGFQQAIAHGMWSQAKALASLNLPDAYESEVWFKLPIYLPSQVEFLTASGNAETEFLIQNAQSHKPHVVGVVRDLTAKASA